MNPRPVILALTLLALPALAAAQTTNPARVVFDSPDHAVVTRYEMGYFIGAATDPVQPPTAVPASAVAGTGTTNRTIPIERTRFGVFTVKLRAVAPGADAEVMSAWSNPTEPFRLAPLAPAVRGLQP